MRSLCFQFFLVYINVWFHATVLIFFWHCVLGVPGFPWVMNWELLPCTTRRIMEKGFLEQREEPKSHILLRINHYHLFQRLWHIASFSCSERNFYPHNYRFLAIFPLRYDTLNAFLKFLRQISLRTAMQKTSSVWNLACTPIFDGIVEERV